MNIVISILRIIANFILPKDKNDKLPPLISSESAHYLLTQDIICKRCGYSMCIPVGEIPKELYGGCNGDKSCYHDFETIIDKEKRRVKTPFGEIDIEWHLEELIKTENLHEGVFYFNDSRWKIKSGKSVYTAHLDEIINTDWEKALRRVSEGFLPTSRVSNMIFFTLRFQNRRQLDFVLELKN